MIQVDMTSSSLCYFVFYEILPLKFLPLSISGQDLFGRERTASRSHVGVRGWLQVASSLKAPRSYLYGILINPSRFCDVFQRRAWRESLFISSVVELHMYGVCDKAVLNHVHSSSTCIDLHRYPLHTYITFRLHHEVQVLPHARPRRPQKCPAASRDDAMCLLVE